MKRAFKTNKDAIIKYCAELNKKSKEGSIYHMGSKTDAVLDIDRWSTGLPELDMILGGGMPCGRIIEIFGAEGGGKTSLCMHLCGKQELCIYIPKEQRFDIQRAKIFGNRKKQLLVDNTAKYGENAFNHMIRFSQEGIPLIVLDSVPSMQSYADMEKIRKAAQTDEKDVTLRVGGISGLFTNYLPTLNEVVEQTGTTVVFVNQIRDKMNALPFGDNINTPGGHALKHYSTIRLQVARKAWIEIPNYNPYSTAQKEKIGAIIKVKAVKNQVAPPYGECELVLIFDRGFIGYADLEEVRKELMKVRKAEWK